MAFENFDIQKYQNGGVILALNMWCQRRSAKGDIKISTYVFFPSMPFGSNNMWTKQRVEGKKVRGRMYKVEFPSLYGRT